MYKTITLESGIETRNLTSIYLSTIRQMDHEISNWDYSIISEKLDY